MSKNIVQKIGEVFSSSKKAYYSFSRAEYYTRHIFPLDLSLLKNFWNQEDAVASKIPILFRNIPYLSSNETIVREMGAPRYKHKFIVDNHVYRVYFYKKLIADRVVILQLHLIDNRFFAACYTYTKHPAGGINSISKVIADKYASTPVAPNQKVQIKDNEGNSIRVIDNINIHIFYLTGNEEVKFLVSSLSEKLKNNKTASEELLLSQMSSHF